MKAETDVLVIGGGAVGVSVAHYASKAGRRVILLEKSQFGSGCSYGNAGLVVPSHFVPLAAPGVIAKGMKWMLDPESPFYIKPRLNLDLFFWLRNFYKSCSEGHLRRAMPVLRDLGLASRELMAELSALDDLDFWFQTRGLLMLFRTDAGERACRELAELAKGVRLEAEVVDQAGILRLDPNLKTSALGGTYFCQDAHIDPARFMEALSAYVQKQGVAVHTSTPVTGFDIEGDRVVGVKTDKGAFSARDIVIATGAWSQALGRMLKTRLPIQPAKGYSITVPVNGTIPAIPLLCQEAKIAVTPLGDRLRFAGTLELAGLDLTINERRVNAILKSVPNYLPDFSRIDVREEHVWSGLRPCTPDGLPFLGRTKALKNVIIAAGHAMVGISLAAITGKLVSELIVEEQPSLDITALSPERFD